MSRFYYANERKANGSPAFIVDGPAHGKIYTELAEGGSQGPWQPKSFRPGHSHRLV
jgi:hypothetical protein